MKKINILISVMLVIMTVLLCSCAYAPTVDDTTKKAGETPSSYEPTSSAPDLKSKEIIEVYIPGAEGRTSILPLFDYGDGYLRSEKTSGTPRATYPVTVEFDGDYVTVHYYVEKSSGGAVQRSLVTGKDNVIIYYSEG